MTNYRWTICAMLFFATTVNYLDRQVLSLTWDEFIKPEFHWDESHYGTITSVFSIVYAICMLFAGRFVDWMGTKKGFLWAIGVWSAGACLHAVCGIVTEAQVGLHSAAELAGATGDVVVTIATVSMYCFLAARCILALGEAGNFPAAIKVTAEYFPKKDRAYATSIFNAGASIGALIAPLTIPILAKMFGWEMAFIVIGGLGFIWMGFWVFMYDAPSKSKHVNQAELDYIEQDNREAGSAPMTDEKDEKRMKFWQCFSYKQTWAFVFGKFMTDGVWWFFLFWTPSSSFIGRYEDKVENQFYWYIRPQETGNKTDVRWLALLNSEGEGVKITGLQPIAFSALHFSPEDLDPGLTRKLQHTIDIVPQKNIFLHVDLKQRGLGGDNSCTERNNYYASIGYKDQSGIFRYGNDSYKRFNLSFNFDTKITDWLDMSFSTRMSNIKNDEPYMDNGGSDAVTWYYEVYRMYPTLSVFLPNGDFAGIYLNGGNYNLSLIHI